MPMSASARGTTLVVVGAAAFASLAVFGRLATEAGMRSSTLLQWRFGLATLVMASTGIFTSTRIPSRMRWYLLGSGIVYTTQTSLYFESLGRITAGTTSLLLYLAPAFVVVYSMILGRRPSRAQVVAFVVALAGLLVIVGAPSPADASPLGVVLGALAGATFGFYLLLGEVVFGDVPPFAIAAHSMAGAAIGFTCLEVFVHRDLAAPTSTRQWLLVAAVVVIPTLVSIPMMFAAIQLIGAGPTSVVSTVEPAFTLLFAAMVLSEPMRVSQLFGGALILIAAVIAQRTAGAPSPVPIAVGAVDRGRVAEATET